MSDIAIEPRRSLAPVVASLQDQVDTLIEENRQLRSLLGAADDDKAIKAYCVAFQLAYSQAQLLAIIAKARTASIDRILALYQTKHDGVGATVELIRVHVHYIRKQLAGSGVWIRTLWGVGYTMDAESVRQLDLIVSRYSQ